MTKIGDYVSVDEKFQASANIEFDLDSADKLFSFLPTSDVTEILGEYLDDLTDNKNPSTQLVGPYGKGKSFLVLSLLQIISGHYSPKALARFKERVDQVDPSLNKKIEKTPRYAPVVINGSFSTLRQAFMNALRSALQLIGKDDLIPDTAYGEAVRLLEAWKKDPVISLNKFSQCNLTPKEADKLVSELRSYSEKAFSRFREIYACVTSGSEFNPILSSDPISTYKAVAITLKKNGYDGLFVVFDEFSKFLEGSVKNQGEELRFLQDFAEMANRSDEHYSIHFCCITHKKLSLYATDDRTKELLQTVEGRFVVRQFNRALKESAELIDFAIDKKAGFNEYFSAYCASHQDYFDEIRELDIFSNDQDGVSVERLARLVYPLNPISAFFLLQISEEVAQNERTLFTFINGDDPHGLKALLASSYDRETVGSDIVYDYFERQIVSSSSSLYRNVAYSCEGACSKYSDSLSQIVIKTLACCRLFASSGKVKSDVLTLSLASDIGIDKVREVTNRLETDGVIRENKFDGSIDFSFVGSREINKRAQRYLKKDFRRLDPIVELKDIYKSDFVLSRKYNSETRMTRYARITYMKVDSFLALDSFQQAYDWPYDGLIVRLVDGSKKEQDIRKKLLAINDHQVLVEITDSLPLKTLNEALLLHRAYEKMGTEDDLSANDKSSLGVMKERLLDEIREVVDTAYSGQKAKILYCDDCEPNGLCDAVGKAFETVFTKTPIVNNEMLNRNQPTTNYSRSRDNLINFILDYGIEPDLLAEKFGESRPEATIFRIFFERAAIKGDPYGIEAVIKLVAKNIAAGGKGGTSVCGIADELSRPPFGIRQGVIPLFFAGAIAELNCYSDNAISLFHGPKEEKLDAAGISAAISSVEKDAYRLRIDSGAKKRGEFIGRVYRLFAKEQEDDIRPNAATTLEVIKSWYRNLPQIVRSGDSDNYRTAFNETDDRFLRENAKYDISPTYYFFEFLPDLFSKQSEDLDEIYTSLEKEKERVEKMSSSIARDVTTEILSLPAFKGQRGSLHSLFEDALYEANYREGEEFGRKAYSEMAAAIASSKSFDDFRFLDELAFTSVKVHILDWNTNIHKNFIKVVEDFLSYLSSPELASTRKTITSVNEAFEQVDENDLSPVVGVLENQINSLLSEYNQSLKPNDLLYVFGKVLKDFQK